MSSEIEVKMMVERGTYTVLKNLIDSIGLHVVKEESLRLSNFYYDTPKLELQQNGIALRVRKTNKDYEMTIKTKTQGVSDNGGVHIHPEYNVKLYEKPSVPNLLLFSKEIFANINLPLVQSELNENMSQECIRHVLLLSNKKQGDGECFVVEVCFDEILYKSKNNNSISSKEVEFELKVGTLRALELFVNKFLDICSQNGKDIRVRLGTLSKMYRAAIYAGIADVPNGIACPDVDPNNLLESIKKLWRCFDSNENEYLFLENFSALDNLKYCINTFANLLNSMDLDNVEEDYRHPLVLLKSILVGVYLETWNSVDNIDLTKRLLAFPPFVKSRLAMNFAAIKQ